MSKKLHLTWLVVFAAAASALWASGCVTPVEDGDGPATDVAEADGEVGDPTAGELAVNVSTVKAKVGAVDAVTVKITLTNKAQHPVRLLSWYAPADELEEDVFVVKLQGQAVDFIGPHYKRPAPEAADYITLASGESLTRTADLTSFYDFSKSGDYSVRYSVDYLPPGAQQAVSIESSDTSLWVQGHFISAPQQIKSGGASGVAFSKCTTSQSDTVTQALAAAQGMAQGASGYLSSTPPSGTPRYTTWFGAFASSGWTTATSHYAAIQDALYNKPMTFDCGCKKKYYAYVYPNQPYTVYLCSVFWGAPLTGTDSKGGTIIHETSHFTVVAGTDDWVYGQSGAKSLAISDPSKALDNADSHEYFAENTPALQ
jgi:peptidyl-Lys metalloendopeptidase